MAFHSTPSTTPLLNYTPLPRLCHCSFVTISSTFHFINRVYSVYLLQFFLGAQRRVTFTDTILPTAMYFRQWHHEVLSTTRLLIHPITFVCSHVFCITFKYVRRPAFFGSAIKYSISGNRNKYVQRHQTSLLTSEVFPKFCIPIPPISTSGLSSSFSHRSPLPSINPIHFFSLFYNRFPYLTYVFDSSYPEIFDVLRHRISKASILLLYALNIIHVSAP